MFCPSSNSTLYTYHSLFEILIFKIYFFPNIINTFFFILPETSSNFFLLLNQLLFFFPLKCLNPCPLLRTFPFGLTLNLLDADFLVFGLFFAILFFLSDHSSYNFSFKLWFLGNINFA